MLLEQRGYEVPLLLADHGVNRDRVRPGLCLVLLGHQDVGPVRLAADVVVDPRKLVLKFCWRMHRGAKHAKSSGIGDCGHDIAAVAKRHQWQVDAQHVADRGLHIRRSFAPVQLRRQMSGLASAGST